MRRDVFVYLSGPIAPREGYTVADNVANATRVFYACIARGIPAFAPQLGAADLSAFKVPYEIWMAYDFAVIDRCTHMLMLPRWEMSAGAVREVQYALVRGMPVFYTLEALVASVNTQTVKVDV